jgi:hypothetical protein
MIRNRYELRQEKKRLRQREKELKTRIISNWHELKSTVSPNNFLGSGQARHNGIPGNDEDSLMVHIFSYAASILGRKLGEKAEEKLADFFSKRREE